MKTLLVKLINKTILQPFLFIIIFSSFLISCESLSASIDDIEPYDVAPEYDRDYGGYHLLMACKTALRLSENPPSSVGMLNAMDSGQCIGSIKTVAILEIQMGVIFEEEPSFCVSNDVIENPPILIRVVLNFLEENPELLTTFYPALIKMAFIESYPC